MIKTEQIIPTSAAVFYKTIITYENYPQFVTGVNQIQVQNKNGQIFVTYALDILSKKIHYTLEHKEDQENLTVSWFLVGESGFFKKNNGYWKIIPFPNNPSQCRIEYGLDIEFKIKIPRFVLNSFINKNLNEVVENFKQQAIRQL